MSPVITCYSDLTMLVQIFDDITSQFLYTTFSVVDDKNDAVYFGQLDIVPRQISPEQFTSALRRISSEELFPEPPPKANFTVAPLERLVTDRSAFYIKRPRLTSYESQKENDSVCVLRYLLIDEATAFEAISQYPRPGIVRYHGFRVRDNRIVGLVLDRYEHDLSQYLKDNGWTVGDGAVC